MINIIYKVGIEETFDLAGGINSEEDCVGYFSDRDDAWERLMDKFTELCTKADVENGDVEDKSGFWKHVDPVLGLAVYVGYDTYGEKWSKSAWLEVIDVK
jgi:hypothetical protein